MENLRWLATCLAVVLAGIILWSEAGFAQGRGNGPQGQVNQDYRGGGPGRGQNYQNCPNYPGNQYCVQNPQGQANNPKGRRGFRRGGRVNQANPPANQSPATQ
jgi:hypothetical protein